MKPIVRSDPSDLDAARKVVSRAERRALDRAETLRAEAEALLKLVSSQAVDAEVKVAGQFDEQIRALREEMAEASRRATVAENQLELLRASGPDQAGGEGPRTELVTFGGEDERLAAAGTATAAQLRAQAEIELARAREDAVALLSAASREAGALLVAAKAAIEKEATAAHSARRQAEEECLAAAAIKEELEVALGQVTQEAARIREAGIVTRDRLVDDATAESTRLLGEARADAEGILDAARREAGRVAEASGPQLERARSEADHLVAAARQEAAEAVNAVRRQLLTEMLALRDAMDQTRESFTQFLASSSSDPAPPDRAVGGW